MHFNWEKSSFISFSMTSCISLNTIYTTYLLYYTQGFGENQEFTLLGLNVSKKSSNKSSGFWQPALVYIYKPRRIWFILSKIVHRRETTINITATEKKCKDLFFTMKIIFINLFFLYLQPDSLKFMIKEEKSWIFFTWFGMVGVTSHT